MSESCGVITGIPRIPSTLLVVTPPGHHDAQLALSAVRAGEWGVLDLGQDSFAQSKGYQEAATTLQKYAADRRTWGVRFDIAESNTILSSQIDSLGELFHHYTSDVVSGPAKLRESKPSPKPAAIPFISAVPLIILAGVNESKEDFENALEQARSQAACVLIEVYSPAAALLAEEVQFDGVILKGNEAGGRVAAQSSFLLLQHLQDKLTIPFWVQGGIGPQTAAAAKLAGAAGVVLCEQLWLAEESPFSSQEQRVWRQLDGSETVCIGTGGAGGAQFRVCARVARPRWQKLLDAFVTGAAWPQTAYEALQGKVPSENSSAANPPEQPEEKLLPMGQEIGLAASLAKQYHRTGAILAAYRRSIEECLQLAPEQEALKSEAPLAQVHGTKYPIAQGPMTRVSDVAPFCASVAEAGALPFLALALLREGEVRKLLEDATERLQDRPWGVGILGFVPAELRKEQMAVVRELPPKYAIVAGGRPSQARELEEEGISTYLHVPSPGLLKSFLKDGARKFIFEGRECGGHVGPQSSFNLWQNVIDVLLDPNLEDPENIQIFFAGGIHDHHSAAMVATMAAPLVARGMKIGVLMGTAYLFTEEIVSSSAINAEFQRQAVACADTALLESGVGHATRCAISPFVTEFSEKKRELVEAGFSSDKIREELEIFNIGRLRIASKGVERTASVPGEGRAPLKDIDEETQRARGMYMIGEIAALHDRIITAEELHEDVTTGSISHLKKLAPASLASTNPRAKKQTEGEDLAIVGLGCMFPDSPNLRAYWQNIVNQFDAVKEVPEDRWEADAYFSPERLERDRVYSKWGSFLEDVIFDPLKYGIPPATLSSIEPVQLLALEVASEALADAGVDNPNFPKQRTSVLFAAAGTHDLGMGYAFRTMMRHYLPQVEGLDAAKREEILADLSEKLPEWTEDSFAGFLMNVIAGRVANRFDLGGTNFTVDAACASSLAALQTAVEQLRAGTCDAALVGAVDGTNNPFCFMSFAKTHALSPRGRSRPFDESADGIALGEGVAAMVLKRLSDAERDGDKIYAVLKGMGSSSDGRNRSLTAPFPAGQLVALERAYQDAGVSPGSVTLLEAHATGTAVGDRVEISALQEMLRNGGAGFQSCGVGSVKSMIGHSKTAAGLASLIKTTLALKHRLLPSTLGVECPNEEFQRADSPLYVNTDNRPWLELKPGDPRRAGVSAFGFGGTNFHVVLEEYGTRIQDGGELDLNPRPAEVFTWTRARRKDILGVLQTVQDQLQLDLPLDLAQLAFSLQGDEQRRAGRGAQLACRLAISATSVDDLRNKLAWFTDELQSAKEENALSGNDSAASDSSEAFSIGRPDGIFYREGEAVSPDSVCFLFPGQGSQSVNMLRDLVLNHPAAFESFLAADILLADRLPRRLTRTVYPPKAFSDEAIQTQQAELNDTRVAQPALAVLEMFYMELLTQFGLRPKMVAGHSFGEYAALWAAGTIDRNALLQLAARRGEVMHAAAADQPGGMAAVFTDAKTTTKALDELEIDATAANHNAPNQTVIAGPNEVIDEAVRRLPEKKLRAKRIPVTAAFHTPAMLGAAEAFSKDLNAARFLPPQLTVFSNVTAKPHPANIDELRGLLIRHITEPVRFVDQVQGMYDQGARVFVECGPGNVLTGLVGRILGDQPHVCIPQASASGNGAIAFASGMAQLSSLGLPVKLEQAYIRRGLEEIGLTAYVESVRKKQEPNPTDWFVNASRAIPVRGQKRRVKPAISTSQSTKSVPSPNGSLTSNGSVTKVGATSAKGILPARTPNNVSLNGSHQPPALAVSPNGNSPTQSSTQNLATTAAPATGSSNGLSSVNSITDSLPSVPSPTRLHDGVTPMSQEVSTAMPQSTDPRSLAPTNLSQVADQSVFANLQTTLNQWLVLQQTQMQVSAKFLETQERIALACLQGGGSLPSLAMTPTTRIAAPAPIAQQAGPVTPATARPAAPAPVAPAAPVAASPVTPSVVAPRNGVAATNGSTKPAATNGHVAAKAPATPAPSKPVAAAPTPAEVKSTTSENGPPPTEEFREALLQAVSDRTGYPIEMLGEDRQLEADLGIDSIKTVEIFSSLNEFHVYLPGGDENQEESLSEFASMKTLRDIINVYDKRRNGTIEEGATAVAVAAPEAANGTSSANGNGEDSVERFTIDAKAAPLTDTDAKKKTSHSSTSS